MEQLHAHEVLHMMEGNSYTEASLAQAIKDQFGEDQRFYACSADDMNIDELIEFLKMKGKFMPTQNEGFTVDISKVCNH
ncbi:MAG: YecH family protein [Dysgonomonas sp.]